METELERRTIFCQKCGLQLAVCIDDVVLEIGNCRIWYDLNYTCRCGRRQTFRPNEPKDLSSLKGHSQEILTALGKDRKTRGH
jgi:transcription elongation factor Elf1